MFIVFFEGKNCAFLVLDLDLSLLLLPLSTLYQSICVHKGNNNILTPGNTWYINSYYGFALVRLSSEDKGLRSRATENKFLEESRAS